MPIIQFRDVEKSFHGIPLYTGVNLVVEPGELLAVVGPNGSGKSVLFRLMCGFLKPDAGSVEIDPAYLSKGREFPERFGVVIDRPGYLAHRTGLQNLIELASIRKIIGEDEVRDTMQLLGLDPNLKQKVRRYSLGMKQKLAIAQALMEKPDVLILDEPFNALDAASVIMLKEHLKTLNDSGVTIVFSSHNQSDIDDLAKRRLRIEGVQVQSVTR